MGLVPKQRRLQRL